MGLSSKVTRVKILLNVGLHSNFSNVSSNLFERERNLTSGIEKFLNVGWLHDYRAVYLCYQLLLFLVNISLLISLYYYS